MTMELLNLFKKNTTWYDFIIAYFVCLAVMQTVYIVIDKTFWFIPVFWYLFSFPIETVIRNYYTTISTDKSD